MHRYLLAMTLVCPLGALLGAVHPLDAEGAASLAKSKNPELVAARSLVAEAQARAYSSGRLSNPEVEVEVAGGQDFEGRVSVGLTQRFPLTARLRFERELSGLEVEAAKLEVRNRERQIAVAARTAFYELAAARESLGLARRQTELADSFAKSLAAGVTEGFGSNADAQQAALATDVLRMTEESLRVAELQAAANLSGILGLPLDDALTLRDSLELPRTAPPVRPMGVRPDLELAELAVRAGTADVSLAKAARWDDFGVGIFVEGERFRDEPDGIEPEALVGVRFSTALPFWQNGSGKVREKTAAQERKAQQLEALRLTVRNEIRAAYQVMTANFRAAAFARDKIVPASRQQASDVEAAYRRGEVDIQNVFRARDRLGELEFSALEAEKTFLISYAEWLGALGDPVARP